MPSARTMVSDLSAECQSNVSALLVRYRRNNPIFAAKTRRQGMRKSVYLIFALLALGIALAHVRKEDVKQADVLAEAIERDPMPTYVDSLWGYSMRYPSFFERATDSLMEREGAACFRYWNGELIELSAFLVPNPHGLSASQGMDSLGSLLHATDRHLGNFGFLVDAKSNTLLGPAPLFDHGNSLCNFAAAADIESREAFLSYANAQYPACYANFLGKARTVLRERHKKALCKLFNFRFRRHPRYNLPQKRLQLLEGQIQERAAFLLSQKDAAPCELKFW